MADAVPADLLDDTFRLARSGDEEAFARWMGMVEIPLRKSLRAFARAVDVEVVVQETFARMWLAAVDSARILEGNHASLRFAFRVARNVALEEMRRYGRGRLVDPEQLDGLPEGRVEAEWPDPALRQAIADCFERLPGRLRKALQSRVREGWRPDRELAESLRMKLNTFLQNIVRGRRLLATCLERRGVRLSEILS
jgi:DNA-directed RNA polymerase specialized sigma24 family protein